jgi:NADH-quinone oxidoreductase subunit A
VFAGDGRHRMPQSYPEVYFPILLQVLLAMAVAGGALAGSYVLGHRVKNRLKEMPYECGNEPVGDARGRFSVKFYLVAMAFILFDVEVVFLFPWAVVFRELKLFGFVAMLLYLMVVLSGFFFLWKKGALDWARSEGD